MGFGRQKEGDLSVEFMDTNRSCFVMVFWGWNESNTKTVMRITDLGWNWETAPNAPHWGFKQHPPG